jgi:hypothetical protein
MMTESAGRQAVDRDQAQRRRTVNDDEVVVVLHVAQGFLHLFLAVLEVDHLHFGAHQVDVGGEQVEVFKFRWKNMSRAVTPPTMHS